MTFRSPRDIAPHPTEDLGSWLLGPLPPVHERLLGRLRADRLVVLGWVVVATVMMGALIGLPPLLRAIGALTAS